LGPIYRLLGDGLNDDDIAVKLNLTEVKVQGCIAWIVHFLELKNRQELVQSLQSQLDLSVARKAART
jgi:DNA-binding CsgD family transcriptional regulator